MRENTSAGIRHPEFLKLGPWDTDVRQRVDDPVADRLAKGDPTLGWEGDERLCLYVNQTRGTWQLVRLEADDVYRVSAEAPGFLKGMDLIPSLILGFMAHDQRRGFDCVESVMDQNRAVDRARDAESAAWHRELAERLHFALSKAGA